MLRAGAGRNLRVMFPMISSLDEFLEAKELLNQCRRELLGESLPVPRKLEVGLMVELPSAVAIIAGLARAADFLSIGTNDLIQYTLGVDRTNEKVAEFYLPHHPAVLRSLHSIARTARDFGKQVSVCGDMAAQPRYLPFLLGIGIRYFSMAVIYLARAQQCLERLSLSSTERLAAAILEKETIRETSALLDAFQP
jgi:phosphotransferase system enzyme I (PtsP)